MEIIKSSFFVTFGILLSIVLSLKNSKQRISPLLINVVSTAVTKVNIDSATPVYLPHTRKYGRSNRHKVSNFNHLYRTTNARKRMCLVLLLFLIASDVELNPGPGNGSIFPCGLCQAPVTWCQQGMCCDTCDIWYHKSCEGLNSAEMEHLETNSVSWHCFKCNSLNIENFTFHNFIFHTSNVFDPLSFIDSTIDSVWNDPFSPLHTSSPAQKPSAVSRNSVSKSIASSASNRKSGTTSSVTSGLCSKKNGNLRTLTVNCQSVRSNNTEFKAALTYTKPDIICGTESWLHGIRPGKDPDHDAILSSEIFPCEYKFFRNDREYEPGHAGGGVFVGVHENLVAVEQPELVTKCELSWVKITLKDKTHLYASSFYMPHRNMEDINALGESLNKISDDGKCRDILLAGDFNCPDINWSTFSVKPGAPERDVQQALLDLSIEHGLTQVHNEPTHQGNILDLVFTSNESLFKSSTSIPGICQHAMVVTDMDLVPRINRPKPKKKYLFSKANWDEIRKDMTSLSTEVCSMPKDSKSVEDMWSTFKSGIQTSMDRNIPQRMCRRKDVLPWFTHKLKRMVKRKARLYKRAKKKTKWAEYRKFQKECKKAFKEAEQKHINDTIQEGLNENNSKPFWRYVKSKKKDSFGIPPLKREGTLFNDCKEKAEILVNQFKSVFTKDSDNNIPSLKMRAKHKLPPLVIRSDGIEKLLSNIKVGKACGPDNISNSILKVCARELAPGLSELFQASSDTGTLPEDWLNANVSPVYKKGPVYLPENYRPVSLTSVTCKLLEHVICKHLLKHLEKNKILTSLNHGFRSGYSCETQLITTIHDILTSKEKGHQIDIAILDFSKAFDTVPHTKLLKKVESYGINGPILNWLEMFLTKRHMKVVVDGVSSEPVSVDSGVPQGTVLGPLLFLCHINDLPEAVKSQVRLFADDCLLYRSVKNQSDYITLQNDLQKLEEWGNTWGMRFNASKCYIMSINTKTPYFYQLSNQVLKIVNQNPYLGVLLSDDMKWGGHISKTVKKANSTLAFLRRNLRYCPQSCKRNAYIALVRSKLEYGAVVWDPHLQQDINILERTQRKAARFITRDYRSREPGSMTKMLANLELDPLVSRRKHLRLALFYRIAQGDIPALPPSDYLTPIRAKRKIKPRNFDDFVYTNVVEDSAVLNTKGYVVRPTSSVELKNSFFPRTTRDWNQLSERVVSAPSLESFKSALLTK